MQLNSTYLLIYLVNPDLFCLTENWTKPVFTIAKLLNCTPPYYAISTPRNDSSKTSSSGGGTDFLIRGPFSQLRMPIVSPFLSYLPSSTFSNPYSVFLEDFSSFLSIAASYHILRILTTGNLNVHLDNSADHFFLSVLSLVFSFNCAQRGNFLTHNINHILDSVTTSADTSLAPAVSVTEWSSSDYFPVFTKLSIYPTPLPPPTLHSFRRLHSIHVRSLLLSCNRHQPRIAKFPEISRNVRKFSQAFPNIKFPESLQP